MKRIFILSIFIYLVILTSCGNESINNNSVENNKSQTKSDSTTQIKRSANIFENPNELVSGLSQNGIGELKKWSNPMDMGWGSLTDYYSFGPSKNGVGMQNNIAYYIEGSEERATKMYVNLNINNAADKKNALIFLNDVSIKTFKTLGIEMPKELTKAILNSQKYKTTIEGYEVSNELEKSKIETWKVNIERK